MERKKLSLIRLKQEAISSNEIEKILSGTSNDDTYIDIPEVSCNTGIGAGGACKEGCKDGCKDSVKEGDKCREECKRGCAKSCKTSCSPGNK